MTGWHAYYDEHGRPVLPPGPKYMLPSPAQQEAPEFEPMDEEGLSFSLDDFDSLLTVQSPAQRQYATERPHDREASGSGSQTQPNYATELAESIFSTPLLVTRGEDENVWDTAVRMSREAEADVVTPDQGV